ncbi:kinase-like protein [Mycena pura]|uniref:Kinase-like protein n=1 Tax=Mycena pura TaxID=153505 RepID=A0AAD6VML9_9AGAR|nr:kinase-like protein [Mycena pura]
MPCEHGHGFPLLEFGESLGQDRRYKIVRKLGWGMNSSTWLVYDQQSQTYLALKALTGHCTQCVQKGLSWELKALTRVSSPPHKHCLQLKDSFTIPGKGSAGSHLCLVTSLLAGDLKSVWGPRLPLPLAKRILLHTLRGLAHAHRSGVVHTDLKPDNIFIGNVMLTGDIDSLLQANSSRRHEAEASYDGIVQAAVSQPLPGPSLEDGMSRTYVLADFGSAQPIDQHLTDLITAESLRPPEIWLGGPWNEKVDIWTFGCLVFELVVGTRLFVPEPKTVENVALDATESVLYQMMCFTQEDFTAENLQVSSRAGQWFNLTCNLKKGPRLLNYEYADIIDRYKVASRTDAESMGTLLKRCLRLDPSERPSAEDLLSDAWFSG